MLDKYKYIALYISLKHNHGIRIVFYMIMIELVSNWMKKKACSLQKFLKVS